MSSNVNLIGKIIKGSTVVGYKFQLGTSERILSMADSVKLVEQMGCNQARVGTRKGKKFLIGTTVNIINDIPRVYLSLRELKYLADKLKR